MARLPFGEKTSIDSSTSRNSDNELGDQNVERGLVDLSATTWTTTTTAATAATTSRYRTQATNEAKADDLLASHSLAGDLQETKQVLRDQLQERRQLEQTSEGRKKLLEQSGETEVRSCIQRRTTRSGRQLALERPRSSPSRIDSRTRIRLNHNDLKRIRYDPAKEAEKAANAAATSSSMSIPNASKSHGGGSDYVKMVYVLPPPPPSRSTSRIRSAHPIKSKVSILLNFFFNLMS